MPCSAVRRLISACLIIGLLPCSLLGGPPSRAEVIAIAQAYATHSWTASESNIRHGRDAAGIEVHTPDEAGRRANPDEGAWQVGENTGVPYKWGGFDTLSGFDNGVKAGKAAGDVYTNEKRREGGAAVSGDAVGVDCSGFVSRCWKTVEKLSTHRIAKLCRKLASPQELKPGDVMNQPGGHVVLFERWLDAERTWGRFLEAAPYAKVMANDYDVGMLSRTGFHPMRYGKIRD